MFNIIKLKEKFYLKKIIKNARNLYITNIGTVRKNSNFSLVFISKKKYSLNIIKNKNVIILTDIKLKKKIRILFSQTNLG